MTKEIKITTISLLLTALVGGLGVMCSDAYESVKESLKNEKEEHTIAVDHLKKYDSLFNVSQIHNKELEDKIKNLNKSVKEAIEENRALTNEALIVIEDSLFTRTELDSIKNSLQ